MKETLRLHPAILPFASAIFLLVASCATAPQQAAAPGMPATFQRVLPLLETNCVHCHGEQRLPSMPAFTSSNALAALIGPGKSIVPGEPERSRFFQVVTLSDNQAGAMPPTGHAISTSEAETLRTWIQSGAPLPAGNLELKPRGVAIRSR